MHAAVPIGLDSLESYYAFLALPTEVKERLKDKASAWYEVGYMQAQQNLRKKQGSLADFGPYFITSYCTVISTSTHDAVTHVNSLAQVWSLRGVVVTIF
jgi:hypothetical protein